jgi:putative ABC transport system substrate-binding protein
MWPRLGWSTEPGRPPVVGVIRGGPRAEDLFERPFHEEMHLRGWEVGRNVQLVVLRSEGHNERLSALVNELVTRPVDVIVVFGDAQIRTAQQESRDIPIVGMSEDLLGSRFVASMARPGSNTTGVSLLASELDVKRLEILHELVPRARRVGVLADPNTVSTRPQLETAARNLGVELVFATGKDRDEINRAVDAMVAARVEAVNVLASPILNSFRTPIVDRMRQARLPAIYQWPESAKEGGLLAYGPSQVASYRQVAGFVDRILKGAKPANLPIQQPTKFELVINLKTAKALGIVIPQTLLQRADDVIK